MLTPIKTKDAYQLPGQPLGKPGRAEAQQAVAASPAPKCQCRRQPASISHASVNIIQKEMALSSLTFSSLAGNAENTTTSSTH